MREGRHFLWRICLLAASVVQLAACGGGYSANPPPVPPKVTITCPSSLTIPASVGTGTTTCTVTTMGGQNPEAIFCEVNLQSVGGSCSVSPVDVVLNTTQKVTVTINLGFSGTTAAHVFVKDCPLGYCPTGSILADAIITIIVT